eukprot:TRINITY_DN11986_c1_g1_i2.p1 TRINITY_DN11986_c1_g1~~TRINITY_DN11986_c1_g1_i2.p1  ORF type:complete len:1198 (-),score=328.84 TRINITY_DN11986_c1_g1_i2:25-3138(-)
MAELPGIENPLFGSPDGGRTFYWNEHASELLKDVGTKLNLLPHKSIKGGHTIQIAQDVEVHYVKDNQHYYVLDLSRLMPPDPSDLSGSQYCHFFRPEFVKQLPFPVSSEVGTFVVDEEKEIAHLTIKTAQKLLRANIQKFAKMLNDTKDTHYGYQFASSYSEMVYQLHLHGINLRYMGLLVSDLHGMDSKQSVQHCLDTLYIEMIARALKSIAHAEMRKVNCSRPHADTKQIKEVMVKILNYKISDQEFEEILKSKYFTPHQLNVKEDLTQIPSEYKNVIEYYSQTEAINTQGTDMCLDLIKKKMRSSKNEVISRLLVLANWEVDKNTLKTFEKQTDFKFDILDINNYHPSSKHLGCVDYSNAKFQLEKLKKRNIREDYHIRLDNIIQLLKSSLYKSYSIPDVWLSLMETTIEYLRFKYDVHYIQWILSSWIKSLKSSPEDLPLKNTITYCHSYLIDKINLSKESECENIKELIQNLSEKDSLEWAKMNLERLFFYCKDPNSNHLFRNSIYYFSKNSKEKDIWRYFTFCTMNINFSTPSDLFKTCSNIPDHLKITSPAPIIPIIEDILKNIKPKIRESNVILKAVPSWAWYDIKKTYYSKEDCKEIEAAYQEWLTNPNPKKIHHLSQKMNSTSILAPQGHQIEFEMVGDTPKFTQVNSYSGSTRSVVREEVVDPYEVTRYVILAKTLALLKGLLDSDDPLIQVLTRMVVLKPTQTSKDESGSLIAKLSEGLKIQQSQETTSTNIEKLGDLQPVVEKGDPSFVPNIQPHTDPSKTEDNFIIVGKEENSTNTSKEETLNERYFNQFDWMRNIVVEAQNNRYFSELEWMIGPITKRVNAIPLILQNPFDLIRDFQSDNLKEIADYEKQFYQKFGSVSDPHKLNEMRTIFLYPWLAKSHIPKDSSSSPWSTYLLYLQTAFISLPIEKTPRSVYYTIPNLSPENEFIIGRTIRFTSFLLTSTSLSDLSLQDSNGLIFKIQTRDGKDITQYLTDKAGVQILIEQNSSFVVIGKSKRNDLLPSRECVCVELLQLRAERQIKWVS